MLEAITHRSRRFPASPEVHRAGLRVVHQDLALFERATIAENFAFESSFPTRAGRIS